MADEVLEESLRASERIAFRCLSKRQAPTPGTYSRRTAPTLLSTYSATYPLRENYTRR